MTNNEILERVRKIKDYKQAIKSFEEEIKAAESELKEMMDSKGTSEYCIDVFTIHYTPVENKRFAVLLSKRRTNSFMSSTAKQPFQSVFQLHNEPVNCSLLQV